MIDTYLLEERVVIMMSLSNAADGFCSTIAWNCADKALFGDCPLDTGMRFRWYHRFSEMSSSGYTEDALQLPRIRQSGSRCASRTHSKR